MYPEAAIFKSTRPPGSGGPQQPSTEHSSSGFALMRIDQTHKPWMIGTVAATLVGGAVYAAYAIRTPAPEGGTPIGLVFGSLALGLMLFAALLSLRKRFPIWRIGRAAIWMRAHLWLGFLALPMVLFHSAFHARGGLTVVLLWLTIIVVGSGIIGAGLQHTVPTMIFREVPFETIYDQIPVIRTQLANEARTRAADVAQSLAPATGPGATVVDTLLEITDLQPQIESLQSFVSECVMPYLQQEGGGRSKLKDRAWSREQFESMRRDFPEAAWAPITAMEEICEEKRQLDHQAQLHRLLHAWLLVHLPVSAALILLSLVHAIGALRY
jgi:hypothetical protein